MSKMEFNKEGLFLLAKKLSNQNYSLPKNLTLKANQTSQGLLYHNSYINDINNSSTKDFLINEPEKEMNLLSKRGIKFKNKFLEKDNIQINEEKMLHLLSERKKKMKLTLSQGNKIKKNIRKNKIIYINLERPSNNSNNSIINNTQINSSRDSDYNHKKTMKYNTKFENYTENKPPSKILYTSNSEYFKNNFAGSFLSDRKSTKIIAKNIDLNLVKSYNNKIALNYNKQSFNFSRNDDKNLKGNLVNQLYSTNKNNSPNMEQINEENIDNNRNNNENENRNNSNINNNININININNNINNNNNVELKSKKLNKSSKKINRFSKPNKFISYIQNSKKFNISDTNNPDNYSCTDKTTPHKTNNSSERVIKKYISQKIYYIKNKKNSNNCKDEETVEDNNNNSDNGYYKYIDYSSIRRTANERNEINPLNYKDYNTYNINVNFISEKGNKAKNPKKNIQSYNSHNVSLMTTNFRPNSMLKSKKGIKENKNVNVIFYQPYDNNNNNQIYTSEIVTKKDFNDDNSDNDNDDDFIDNSNSNSNNNKINYTINNNTESNLEATKKLIRKKIYKNKPMINISNDISNKTIDYQNRNKNIINNSNILNNKKDIIHLEDLLILEGKFCHLLECIKFENPVPKICVEWWNFYTYCSFFGKFPKLFPKETKDVKKYYVKSDYQIAHDAVMLELLSMIMIYKILCDSHSGKNLINFLKKLINEVHQNFLIECDYILSRVGCKSMTNIWIQKLKNLILDKKNWEENFSEKDDFHLNLLKQGNISIQNIIQYLIEQYSILNPNDIDINSLIYFNENITKIHLIELSGFFNKAINQENMKINKAFSYIIKNNMNNPNKYISIVVPYLPEEVENKKHFTLVLDLDETLISFKFDEKRRGIFKMRPGLYYFLESVGKKYELVIFTAGTQEYADPILDRIEKNGKIFAKRLYRQHATFMNNVYLKDLTRLGRDLSKIIIVDNMPQNFSLQKENGILIKNYFGQDTYDTTLKDLTPILLKIASNPKNDVRKELKKYREEIFTKITTNLRC